MRVQLSIVVPVFNEEANIAPLAERLAAVARELAVSHEIVFVNDGSRDRSLRAIAALAEKDHAIKYIDLSRNFGHQIAATAGIDMCSGDAVVLIDADLQDPPERIRELYAKLREGYDVVYAKRRRRENETAMKRVTARLFYRLLAAITPVPIPLDTGDFRIISRKVVEGLKQMPEQNRFLRGQISWLGHPQTFIEYDRAGRAAGRTNYTYRKMIRLAFDAITGFSDLPLKIATYSGFIVSGFAFVVMLYTLYARFVTGNYERGWASLMVSILFLGGVQLIALGIIGEYIARISANVRRRPLYIVSSTNIDLREKSAITPPTAIGRRA
jgi:polyisoprenyl-phosphate glycosyltransferase